MFVYSVSSDSVFCIHCALFLPQEKRKNVNTFVNVGCSGWHNIIERESNHLERKYHKDIMEDSHDLINRFEKPEGTIDYHSSTIYQERCNKYPKILEIIARAIHFHGKQGLALRGHRESLQESDENQNLGNFLTYLKELQHYCPELKEHLQAPQNKHVTYLSPTSQNEMIEVIGKKIILGDIVEEIKTSGFHSISADEVTSSNDEILSLCFRYVDENLDIQEKFVEFLDLERLTGEHIAQKILAFYEEVGISPKQCRGQCYDGAPNMQSEKKGVASFISKESENAPVTHCNTHNLNLSISASAKIQLVDNVIESYKSTTFFFKLSPKKESLLKHIADIRLIDSNRRKVLIGMCKTRWSERDLAYEHFYLALPFIVEALEIINGTHLEIGSFEKKYTEGWDYKSKREATSLLNAITSFEFIICLIGLYRFLHQLSGITTRLQGRSVDIIAAYDDVSSVMKDIKNTRNSIEKEFRMIFEQAERVATKVGTEPSMPRIAKRQSNRDNTEADSPEIYYRRVFAIPFIDTLYNELELRFTKLSYTASRLLFLIPAVITKVQLDKDSYQDVIEMYGKDLPNQDVVDVELASWKRKWLDFDEKTRPTTIASSLKQCSKDMYPNLFVLLKIAATLPVTSCECERSFSVLRRLRIWLRASMTTPRLSSLALINIHRGVAVDYKRAVKIFLELHPRKLKVPNLIFDHCNV